MQERTLLVWCCPWQERAGFWVLNGEFFKVGATRSEIRVFCLETALTGPVFRR